jgi:NitT/TauT family transport system permease protein
MVANTLRPSVLGEVSEAKPTHARDMGAMIVLILTVIFTNVLDVALRQESQIGLAFRNVYLRRVLWVLLAITVVSLIVRAWRSAPTPFWRLIYGGMSAVLILFTVNAGLFVWFGIGIITIAPLISLLMIGCLMGAVILAAPWERGRLWRESAVQILPAMLIAIGVLVVWEVLIDVFSIRQFLLPKPTAIGQNLLDTFPDLISKSWVTFQNALWGYAIGCGLGIFVGTASARFPAFSRAILPFAIAANSTPIIAFAPIMGFWFGVLNPASKIAIVAIMVFFPCMINTVRGLLSADGGALELMRSLATPQVVIFQKVRFPAALPYIFNGLKFGTTWSVIGAVVGEFFGGTTQGIGFYIRNKPTEFNFPAAWAAIVIVSLLGILFYWVVSLAERVIMPWKHSQGS